MHFLYPSLHILGTNCTTLLVISHLDMSFNTSLPLLKMFPQPRIPSFPPFQYLLHLLKTQLK